MKIAFAIINANRREGTSRAVVEVAERLAVKHDVTLISRTVESVNLTHIRWLKVHAPSWPDVAEFEFSRIQMDRLLRKGDFDIIHSAGCNTRYADVYAIQTVHPVKMHVNGLTNRNGRAGVLRRLSRWLYDCRVVSAELHSYKPSNRRGRAGYLPVSQGTKTELLNTYDLPGVILEVIPNGADLMRFHRDRFREARSDLRAEFKCKDDSVVFLFAGGEWKRKGLELALRALAEASDLSQVLIVAGSDPDAAAYYELAESLGIASQVRWLGFRTDIEQLYASADVFLFPSYYEAFSLATIEAAASHLPVIMCDISGAQELIGDGKAGFLVDREPKNIAAAMNELTRSPQLREQMGQAGREKVEGIFNWDQITAQTEHFYCRLLSKRSGIASA